MCWFQMSYMEWLVKIIYKPYGKGSSRIGVGGFEILL